MIALYPTAALAVFLAAFTAGAAYRAAEWTLRAGLWLAVAVYSGVATWAGVAGELGWVGVAAVTGMAIPAASYVWDRIAARRRRAAEIEARRMRYVRFEPAPPIRKAKR